MADDIAAMAWIEQQVLGVSIQSGGHGRSGGWWLLGVSGWIKWAEMGKIGTAQRKHVRLGHLGVKGGTRCTEGPNGPM